MRKLTVIIMLIACLSTATAGKKQVVILHTNDTHSCIMPLSENLADTTVAGRGGFLRRMALVQKERRDNPGLLLIDSGDFSQGSPYYTLFKGDVEIGMMNMMEYDAATIGNHEFDFGLDNMARIFRTATFPIVCSNYDFTGTPVEGLVKEYTVITRDGMRIGMFGLSPDMKGLIDENKCQGVAFLDPIETAKRMSTLLRKKEKCDVVICISHLGWDMDGECDDAMLATATQGIDIILGGHSHTNMEKAQTMKAADGKTVTIDQNGKSGIWIGKLVVDLK